MAGFDPKEREKSILMRLVLRLHKLIRFGLYHLIKKMKDVFLFHTHLF